MVSFKLNLRLIIPMSPIYEPPLIPNPTDQIIKKFQQSRLFQPYFYSVLTIPHLFQARFQKTRYNIKV